MNDDPLSQTIFIKKYCEERDVDLSLIEEKKKKTLCSYQRFQYIHG